VNGAGSTGTDTTSKFGSHQPEVIAQNPEQGRIRSHINFLWLPVDIDRIYRHGFFFSN
jgi:hypothetical protein